MINRRPPDDLRQFSPMFDRGFTHFLTCLHTPERMGRNYPTRDVHDEEQEADFIAGFNAARREHEYLASQENRGGDGRTILEGY